MSKVSTLASATVMGPLPLPGDWGGAGGGGSAFLPPPCLIRSLLFLLLSEIPVFVKADCLPCAHSALKILPLPGVCWGGRVGWGGVVALRLSNLQQVLGR